MSLPAQNARPWPQTSSTRTSSMAATRSSAASSAPVSARLSALSAWGRLSVRRSTPSAAGASKTRSVGAGSACTVRSVGGLFEEGAGCGGARLGSWVARSRRLAAPTQQPAEEAGAGRGGGGGDGPEVGAEERDLEERRVTVGRLEAAVQHAVYARYGLSLQHLDGRLGVLGVGQRRVADVFLAAVLQWVVR